MNVVKREFVFKVKSEKVLAKCSQDFFYLQCWNIQECFLYLLYDFEASVVKRISNSYHIIIMLTGCKRAAIFFTPIPSSASGRFVALLESFCLAVAVAFAHQVLAVKLLAKVSVYGVGFLA